MSLPVSSKFRLGVLGSNNCVWLTLSHSPKANAIGKHWKHLPPSPNRSPALGLAHSKVLAGLVKIIRARPRWAHTVTPAQELLLGPGDSSFNLPQPSSIHTSCVLSTLGLDFLLYVGVRQNAGLGVYFTLMVGSGAWGYQNLEKG